MLSAIASVVAVAKKKAKPETKIITRRISIPKTKVITKPVQQPSKRTANNPAQTANEPITPQKLLPKNSEN